MKCGKAEEISKLLFCILSQGYNIFLNFLLRTSSKSLFYPHIGYKKSASKKRFLADLKWFLWCFRQIIRQILNYTKKNFLLGVLAFPNTAQSASCQQIAISAFLMVWPKDNIEKIDFQELIFAVVNWPNSEF